MIDIQWKGKIGYGDIVSPVCYAHNISHKLKTKVNLTFRWDHNSLRKFRKADPERLWERASMLFNHCARSDTDVTLIHSFDHPLDINHTNYTWDDVWDDPFHNYWYPKESRKPTPPTFVINSTEGNAISLEKYGKSWKDPINSRWPLLVEQMKKKGRVVVVDYRTPFEHLYNVLRKADCFIGYHGTAAWVAKFTHTPSIVFSSGGTTTRNAFHYAKILKDMETPESFVDQLDSYIHESSDKINRVRDLYNKYQPGQKLLMGLTHEKL